MSNVEDALKPGTFDLLEFVQGRGRPKDTVVINVAEDVAYQKSVLLKQLAAKYKVSVLDEDGIQSVYNSAEPEELELLAPVDEALKKGELVFHIQAIPADVRDNLMKVVAEEFPPEKLDEGDIRRAFGVEVPSSDAYLEYSYRLAAAAIIGIEAPSQGVEMFLPAPESLLKSLKALPPSQIEKLTNAVRDLMVSGEFFESKVTPDF